MQWSRRAVSREVAGTIQQKRESRQSSLLKVDVRWEGEQQEHKRIRYHETKERDRMSMVGTWKSGWMTGFGKELENPNDYSFWKRERDSRLHSRLSPTDGRPRECQRHYSFCLVRVDRQNRTTAD